MLRLKRFLLGLSKFMLFICLILLMVTLFIKATIGDQKNITASLQKSNSYSTISGSIKEQLTKTNNINVAQSPILTSVTNQLVTESQVQQIVDPAISQVYDWLNGKTQTLTINIETTPIKDNFKKLLTDEVNKYVQSLPVCTPQDARPQDYVSAKCLPAGVDRNLASQILEQQLVGANLDQFGSGEISFFDSSTSKQSNQDDPLKQIPRIYQFFIKASAFLAIICLVLVVLIFLLSSPKYLAFRSLFWIFSFNGLLYLLFIFLAPPLLKGFVKPIFANQSKEVFQQISVFLDNLTSYGRPVLIKFGVVLLTSGLACLVIYLLANKKAKKALLENSVHVEVTPTKAEGY